MKKATSVFYLIITMVFISCNREETPFFAESKNCTKIEIEQIKMDTINLNIETSFAGFLTTKDGNLYFADKRFCWVYKLDTDGNILGKFLGKGEGPKELNTAVIDFFQPIENGFFFMGVGDDCHLHNQDFTREKIFIIDKGVDLKKKKKLKKINDISADTKWVYTPSYVKLVTRAYQNKIYYNIVGDHPNFNGITTPIEYYSQGRIIACLDLSSGKLEEIYGRLSPVYSNYKYIPQFAFTSFDISKNGDFYVCYEADPTIYVYNNQYKIKDAFGYGGKDMNTKYKEFTTIESVRREYLEQRESCGYYSWIEYNDDEKLLLRGYTKGENSNTDGIQFYRNQCLIGDVPVPKGTKIIGYIKPYYYSDVIFNEETESAKIYRFKLN